MEKDKEKGAKEAPNIGEQNNNSKGNHYSLPINYLNFLRFDLDVISINELLLLHAFIVKSSAFGSGFFFSISDAYNEMRIDKKAYRRIVKKWEQIGILSRETTKGNHQKIYVNFDILATEEFLEQIVKDQKKENLKSEYVKMIKDSISEHGEKCYKRDLTKKKSANEISKIEEEKAIKDLIRELNEIYKQRRSDTLKKGQKLPAYIDLAITQDQKSKIKEAMLIHGSNVIKGAATAYFDHYLEIGQQGIVSVMGYFLQQSDKGNFSKVTYWSDQYNKNYIVGGEK